MHNPDKGKASIWQFELEQTLVGNPKPKKILNLFSDVPRSIAVTPDGKTLYVASLFSGNQTTLVPEDLVLDKPEPTKDLEQKLQPKTGLIVKFENQVWQDSEGRDYSKQLSYKVSDQDVFVIDAETLTLNHSYQGVGTTLLAMSVDPVSLNINVASLEANNHRRFEGDVAESLKGRFISNRLTQLSPQGQQVVDLNPHVDIHGQTDNPLLSVSQPVAMISTEQWTYIAAMGSNKLVRLHNTEWPTRYQPKTSQQLILSGSLPTGLAIDEKQQRLFVYTRGNNSLASVDLKLWQQTASTALTNPEPDYVIKGREFLYNASLTSSNGTQSCSSCHIFGDMDHLAWDLGNPMIKGERNRNRFVPFLNPRAAIDFHPMKGPMMTQTLKGLAGNGPLHWRGDKSGIHSNQSNEPLEHSALKEFNSAFVSLLGREKALDSEQMQAFTDFVMTMRLPPNPIRNLDNSLTSTQSLGKQIYFNQITTYDQKCVQCHTLNPQKRQFGTSGLSNGEADRTSQDFKVPQLRNVYQKTGMSKRSDQPSLRGFGFTHDGGFETLPAFFSGNVFKLNSEYRKRAVADFVFAMDSDFAPVTGQQVTLTSDTSIDNLVLVNQLYRQVEASGEHVGCVISVRGRIQKSPVYWPQVTDFQQSKKILSQLKSPSEFLTFTCAPRL